MPVLPLPPPDIKASYEKIEYRIPMRDGVRLYTAVYVPRNAKGKFPVLMERTPYSAGPYGPDKYANFGDQTPYINAGYAFAFQDVRGCYMSEGKWENVRPLGEGKTDEATDTYDTVDYLVKQVKGNNGKVGLRGISYPGFYAAAGGINTHPALKAISPQAPVSDWFIGDDVNHRGAFFLQDNWDFSQWFDVPRKGLEEEHKGLPDYPRGEGGAYGFFLRMVNADRLEKKVAKGRIPYWREIMKHGKYDAYWQHRSLPGKMANVSCAVLTVGGLYDAEDMWGAFNIYRNTEVQNPTTFNVLVMGPWAHGQWYAGPANKLNGMDFDSNTGEWYRKNIEFPFFERFLHNGPDPNIAEATVFNTGANKWRQFGQWPPLGLKATPMYLAEGKTLVVKRPEPAGEDSYVNDPNAPTPYLAKPETPERPGGLLVQDEAWNALRADVLTFQSAPLAKSATYGGPIDADVWVKTTGTDMDLVVKVVDVWPNGTPYAGQMRMVRSEVIRGRFRDSFTDPAPFKPGQPTLIKLRLNDILHTFGKGHRIGVMLQSSWFPLVDRNPNSFIDPFTANRRDYRKATITVLNGGATPSRIVFNELTE
ncbi:CocE/NonD family hydrolase [soil metagenome]